MSDPQPETVLPEGPRWIGPYRLLSCIGEGGMGVVYLAEQSSPLRRQVALKLMREDRTTEEFIARFEMERQALERMDHPNIARVLGAGVTETGRPYFVMEHVPGVPIDSYCDRKKLTIEARLELFRQVCAGVQHAHTNGIMHRDLKPSNILVTEVDDEPVPKIIDFGLARAIDVHGRRATLHEELLRVIGTLAYMSPEQAGIEAVGIDARTDVYSLGVLLYELLTGRLPFDPGAFERAGILAVRQIIKECEPVRPSTRFSTVTEANEGIAQLRRADPRTLCRKVAGELDWIVLKALQKERRARYETVRDFARDIERYLRHEPVEAGPPSPWYRTRKWIRRHRAGVAAGTLIAASLIGGLVISTIMYRRAEAARIGTVLDADADLVTELERRADELWPARSGRIADLERWLTDTDLALERLALHRGRPERVGLDASIASGQERLRLQMAHARAVRALEGLQALATTLRPAIEARLALAKRSLHDTIETPAAAWRDAAAYVASSPLYQGFMGRLEPVEGLIPIGPDPDGGLLAFQVHGTGAAPVIVDGNLPPRLGDAIVLLLVPPGTCHFGSQFDDPQAPGWFDYFARYQSRNIADWSETPMQTVPLEAYLLAKYELTQDQWMRLGGSNFSQNRPTDGDLGKLLRPIDFVSWSDCEKYLSRYGLRMPTEVRWEYACRNGGGEQWPISGKPDPKRQVSGRVDFTDLVGHQRLPNAWGFYDMLGNVHEWCLDGYTNGYGEGCRAGDGYLLTRESSDPRRTLRGGSYLTDSRDCRSGIRFAVSRDNRHPTYGVRPCLELPSR